MNVEQLKLYLKRLHRQARQLEERVRAMEEVAAAITEVNGVPKCTDDCRTCKLEELFEGDCPLK